MLDFTKLSLAINLLLFTAAGGLIWIAGTRITRYAEAISRATGIGHVVLGLILLAGVTSLPEIAVTVTAAAGGNADLAINNLFGSIAMQVAVLAAVDFLIGRKALTSVVPEPSVLLLGALNVLLLSVAAAAIVVGDVPFLGIGVWAWLCLAGYVGSVWLLSQTDGRRPWLAARGGKVDRKLLSQQESQAGSPQDDEALSTLVGRTAFVAVLILVGGYVLSRAGEAIAEQTGLGSSFVGFALVAISTSLPELSTTLAAARLGLFAMAISDILGTNLINVALLFLADAVATGEPVLDRAGPFSIFGALLGIILTIVFVIGLLERRDRTVLRMGVDSLVVLVVYLTGLVILYRLR